MHMPIFPGHFLHTFGLLEQPNNQNQNNLNRCNFHVFKSVQSSYSISGLGYILNANQTAIHLNRMIRGSN